MFSIKNFLFLLLFGLVLLSSRCRKPDCSKDVPLKIMIPQEVLDYVDFKAGSYWIYQDSATGRIDSEVVVSSRHYMQDRKDNNECGDMVVVKQYENIEMILERYDSTGKKTYSWIREFNNYKKMHYDGLDGYFVIDNYDSFLIGYPFNETYNVGDYKCTESIIDTISLNGHSYYKVLGINEVSTSLSDYKLYKFLGRNVGLLKLRNIVPGHPDYNVNLLRYKIN